MKVKGLVLKEEVVKKAVNIKVSDAERLDKYHAYVQEKVGQDVPHNELIAQMAVTLMDSDRDFSKWLKEKNDKPKVEATQKEKPKEAAPNIGFPTNA